MNTTPEILAAVFVTSFSTGSGKAATTPSGTSVVFLCPPGVPVLKTVPLPSELGPFPKHAQKATREPTLYFQLYVGKCRHTRCGEPLRPRHDHSFAPPRPFFFPRSYVPFCRVCELIRLGPNRRLGSLLRPFPRLSPFLLSPPFPD